jgi:hypothetical protein
LITAFAFVAYVLVRLVQALQVRVGGARAVLEPAGPASATT